MPRSSEEFPGQADLPALIGEAEIPAIPKPDPDLTNSNSSGETPQTSTLIEFPGVNRRSEPPWRRELSRRVREVQERRVKEAIETPVAEVHRQPPARDQVISQLELVPELPSPAMKQLVENALRRLERARRTDPPSAQSWSQTGSVSRQGAATAVARAKEKVPPAEAMNAPPLIEPTPETAPPKTAKRSLTRRKLAIVPLPEMKVDKALPEIEANKAIAKPVRLIADVEDAALSYLDDHFPDADARMTISHAGCGRRLVAALCDFAFVAILAAPFAAGIELANASWTDPPVVLLMIAAISVVMIGYQTLSTALRGQTWGMRLLSLRAIDPKTRLIPTGGQSIRRALGYVFSVWTLGLGFFYALVDSEHLAPHDRFSGTIVVRK